MIALAALANRLRPGRKPASPRFTAEDVKRYLRRQLRASVPEAEEIRRVLESVPVLTREPRIQRRYRGFQRYLEVLPRILYLYLGGKEPGEIAASLHFLATDYGVEAVVEIPAQVVAERLNATSLALA